LILHYQSKECAKFLNEASTFFSNQYDEDQAKREVIDFEAISSCSRIANAG